MQFHMMMQRKLLRKNLTIAQLGTFHIMEFIIIQNQEKSE